MKLGDVGGDHLVYSDAKNDAKNEKPSLEVETEENSAMVYMNSIKNLCRDKPFILLLVSYGLNVGCYYALSTLLVQIIKPTFYDTVDNKQHTVSIAS